MWREGHYRTFFSKMLNNGIKWTKRLSGDVKDLTPRDSRTHTGTSEVYILLIWAKFETKEIITSGKC